MRFEIPFMLAFASAALAEHGIWTMERHQSDNCSDTGGGNVIGKTWDGSEACNLIYEESDAADPEDRKNLPAIKSVLFQWNGDIKGGSIHDLDSCTDHGSSRPIVNDTCVNLSIERSSQPPPAILAWKLTKS